ncbi:hypothetical protein Efla_004550 [Eimeria flavescens]
MCAPCPPRALSLLPVVSASLRCCLQTGAALLHRGAPCATAPAAGAALPLSCGCLVHPRLAPSAPPSVSWAHASESDEELSTSLTDDEGNPAHPRPTELVIFTSPRRAAERGRSLRLPAPVEPGDLQQGRQQDVERLQPAVGGRALRQDVRRFLRARFLCLALSDFPTKRKWLNLPIGTPFFKSGQGSLRPAATNQVNNNHIHVYVDHPTSWVELLPLPNPRQLWWRSLFQHMNQASGGARFLVLDSGPEFTAELLKQLSSAFGINKLFAAPYHPLDADAGLWRCRQAVLRGHQRIAEKNRKLSQENRRRLTEEMLMPKERQEQGKFKTRLPWSPFLQDCGSLRPYTRALRSCPGREILADSRSLPKACFM